MNTLKNLNPDHPRRVYKFLRWPLLGLEIYSLFVFCNCLFLVPAPYMGVRGLMIAISALLALGSAWASGRMFLSSSLDGPSSRTKIFSTPPVIICMVIMSVAAFIFALALLGMG